MNARLVRGMVVLATGAVIGACSAPGASVPIAGRSGPPSSAMTPMPSTSTPTILATSSPTAALESGERSTPPPVSDAPLAVLVVGGDRYAGKVGGFTFRTYSQSAPWLPATALDNVEIPATSAVRVQLDEGAIIAEWTARVASASDVTAEHVTGLAQGSGTTAAFIGPAAGDWVLSMTITYGDGLGNGAYYWHLVVR